MASKHFNIIEEQRKEYAAGYLLDLMINGQNRYSVVLEGSNRDLEPLLVHMMTVGYVDLDEDNFYMATNKGLEKLENLKQRYEEYLAHFDLYCAVDLEEGLFAFEKIFEYDDSRWDGYINQERFVDLRVAVAWFKKINPSDLVFLSFLKEGVFDVDKANWQFDLVSGLMWEKIEKIVDTAIQIEDLGYRGGDRAEVSGMSVIEDVITQGAELSAKLHAEEEHLNQADNEFPNDYYDANSPSNFVTTYESYYDPFYISPIWFLY
ncbi:MAG: hypothetical protein COB67_02810 [SAR324 cluster bacterium]|uniref:Uncharacterized protein n=1 Tax=SAR324 cluster bacterium TaxID=2024889 RepID=A0A2A4T9M8_9DELT|nr:MAG: hypothetical protein COB67_02810 [SAR324 cluster bacterium]